MAYTRREAHYGDRVVRCYVERPRHVHEMLTQAAASRPNAVAIVDGPRRISYAELEASVDRIAGNLASFGIRPRDRVALLIGNRREFVEALLALARLSAVCVPINIRQQTPENEYVLRHSGAKALIYEGELCARIPSRAALPDLEHCFIIGPPTQGAHSYADLLTAGPGVSPLGVDEEAPFAILYTSGTTGRPKGATLTQLSVIHSCLHYRECFALGSEDISLLAVPASHVTGIVAIILSMVLVAGRTVIMPTFKARPFLELASAERITHAILVPAMYNLCLLDPQFARYDLAAWRIGGFGGAPMPQATISRLAENLPGMMLCNAYGATETTSPATLMPLGQGLEHIASVGKTVPCAEVRVMDDLGRELPPGTPGEIWIAGPMVIPGYWDSPQSNRENFVGGYWKSGDIGAIDVAGFLSVFDRKKDMINRGGYKIYSVEIENVLSHHPDILECAALARPDPVLGEKVHVFVVPRGAPISEQQIRAYCSGRLADYKIPDRITFLTSALPRNAAGKVLKTDLKARIAAEPS
jgi:long-chain acyl-CoA synthetase